MIEIRALRPNEIDAWVQHCQGVFQLEDTDYFQRHYTLDPYVDCSLIFIVVHDGEIVSTVRVFDRKVWISGRSVHIGGIGEVSTKIAYRGQGYAGALLNVAIEAMQKRDMPVSVLFGNKPLYEKMGWRFAPRRYTITQRAILPEISMEVTIRPYQPTDLPYLMGIYDFFAGRLDGAVIRSEAYWRRWIVNQWQTPAVFLLGDRPFAYCCTSKSSMDDMLCIDELCASPDGEMHLPSFVKAMMLANGSEKARFHTSFMPHIAGEDATVTNAMMVRINDCTFFDGVAEDFVATSMRNAGMFSVDMF